MSESHNLIKELKRQLKLSGIHYVDVAKHLGLSEGSVKRLLAEGSQISLDRLERICQLIGLEMAELFKLSAARNKGLESLTLEQEKQLVDDKGLLLVAVCVVNGYRFEQIIEQYTFDELELIQSSHNSTASISLTCYQAIRFVCVSPRLFVGTPAVLFSVSSNNKFKMPSSKAISPPKMKTGDGDGADELANKQKMQQKLQKVIDEFYQICQSDDSLDMNEKHGTSSDCHASLDISAV